MKIWKQGDAVRIAYKDRTVTGEVMLASYNGRSLMLEFEALLGGFAGRMPVLWDEQTRTFRDLVEKEEVGLS